MSPPEDDRYEPLPGLLSLPGFLYRKLGPRGRLALKLGGSLFVVTVAVAAIMLLPRIAESNRQREAKERRHAVAALAERRRRLIAEQRPRRASVQPGSPRGVLVSEFEGRILADARARAAVGKLPGPPAKRVSCQPLKGVDPDAARVPYDCIAVTSELPSSDGSPGGVLGHSFRGVVQFATGHLAWCKVSGRTIEDLTSKALVTIPRACSR